MIKTNKGWKKWFCYIYQKLHMCLCLLCFLQSFVPLVDQSKGDVNQNTGSPHYTELFAHPHIPAIKITIYFLPFFQTRCIRERRLSLMARKKPAQVWAARPAVSEM